VPYNVLYGAPRPDLALYVIIRIRRGAMMDDSNTLPVATDAPRRVSTVARLADIPEEEIWLSKQKSARTRRAYRLDVQHFMSTLSISSPDELRQADHKAVIAWERYMREVKGAASSTIRRRLAALSSLYKHLVRYGHAARNPVGEGNVLMKCCTSSR
jgi:Phage integrase, N-terminal SAM-like domain